jgi:hypothetical protein
MEGQLKSYSAKILHRYYVGERLRMLLEERQSGWVHGYPMEEDPMVRLPVAEDGHCPEVEWCLVEASPHLEGE